MDSERRLDSSSVLVRLRSSVVSACMVGSPETAGADEALPLWMNLLAAVRTVFAVFGLAADNLAQELIALVAQLLMEANLRRVVLVNRRVRGHHEELLERSVWGTLITADIAENRIGLPRA